MPMDREEKLEQALALLADREEAYETACKEAASAESDYRIKLAKEFLKADGSMDIRKHAAIVAVEKELRERDRTEAVKEFTRVKVKDVQDAVDARKCLLYSANRTNQTVT